MTAKAKNVTDKSKKQFINLDNVKIGDNDPANFQRIDGHWKMQIGKTWANVADVKMIELLETHAGARIKAGQIQILQEPDGKVHIASKEEIEFKNLAQEIVDDTLKVGQKWFNLCKYIRGHKIDPKQTTKWLLDLGFHKSKASEVNRVAQSSDEVFSQYEARLIGWRGVLQLSRGNIAELKQADAVTSDAELAEALNEVEAELELAEKEASAETELSDEEKAEAKKSAARSNFIKMGNKILALAEKYTFKNRKWKNGAYVLELRKAKSGETQGDEGTERKD